MIKVLLYLTFSLSQKFTLGCSDDLVYPEYLKYGDQKLKAGDYNAAISFYRVALSQDTLNPFILGRLSKVYSAKGNDLAASRYSIKSRGLLLRTVNTAIDSAEYDRAEDSCKFLLEIDPTSHIAHYFLAKINILQGEMQLARSHFSISCDLAPENYAYLTALGELNQKMGYIDDAISNYEKAISVNINSHISYIELGSIYLRRGDINTARDYYEKSLLIKPDYQKALEALKIINK